MGNRLYLVDVFAQRAYSGNPLAVVIDDDPLDAATMQQIAAEMNFSETTFVSPEPEADGGFCVRIFTPAKEIDFAGHPILGSAWVIRSQLGVATTAGLRLNLRKSSVPVAFESATDGTETVWFRAPPMRLGAYAPVSDVASALGLGVEDIDSDMPVQLVSAGTAALIVPLRTLDALRRSRLDLDRFERLSADGFPPMLYQFTHETLAADNDMSARFFFEAHGEREDPATGNGAAFLGAYMLEHMLPQGQHRVLRIEQGHALHRPSLIQVRMQLNEGQQDVSVGGQVLQIAQGYLT